MPNRVLREGILTSERVDALASWPSEVFYRRLMSVVDDYGRYFANPSLLRAACFPLKLDKVSNADVEKWLADCAGAALVSTYEVEGKRYLQMLDFRQQVRAEKSKYPEPLADATQVSSKRVAADKHLHTKAKAESVVVEEGLVEANPLNSLPPYIDSQAWDDFLAMRVKIRKPATDRAKALILRELEKLRAAGEDPTAILEQSIRNCWQDVFPIRKSSAGVVQALPKWRPGSEPDDVLRRAAAALQLEPWQEGETHGQFRQRIVSAGGEEMLKPAKAAA